MEYSTRCHHCHVTTTRRERTHGLPVSLPPDETQAPTSLGACLHAQLAEENIKGYACDKCRAERSATRTSAFVAHPPVLLLNLKRTKYDRKTNRPYKDYRPISFPPALPAASVPLLLGAGKEASSSSAGDRAGPSAGREGMVYRLAAVVIHSASSDARTGRVSAERGHYYALCREGRGEWLEKNDLKVRETSEAEVLKHDRGCFVLAYELVGPDRVTHAAPASAGGASQRRIAQSAAAAEEPPRQRRKR